MVPRTDARKLGRWAGAARVIECLTAGELGSAFGRDHVVHALWRAGRSGQRLDGECRRLCRLSPGAAVETELRRVGRRQQMVVTNEMADANDQNDRSKKGPLSLVRRASSN